MKNLTVILAIFVALTLCMPVSMSFAAAKKEATAASVLQEKININSATMDQLVTIPGIGKVTAERILSFREQNGKFTKLDDLLQIKGIGKKSLMKMSPYLSI